MRFQPIYDIAVICAKKGLHHAVLCPGSRCAPLTLAFARHPEINARTISDERSAGFIALGIAQETKRPAILLCTSGTAAYNFAPAIAEAWFSKRPLVVFTADRPTEWIGQQDGQTIFQTGIFGRHVKHSYQLPQSYEHPDDQWAINRMVNEAINLAQQEPQGPVHINAPFREPLYPSIEEQLSFSDGVRIIEETPPSFKLSEQIERQIAEAWKSFNRILVVAGQHDFDEELNRSLSDFIEHHKVALVGDVISNVHGIEKCTRHADLFLGQCPEGTLKKLKPDLLITFGHSTISKNLKLFLRQQTSVAHWHIQPAGFVTDTFQKITKIVQATPRSFFDFLRTVPAAIGHGKQNQETYTNDWEDEEQRVTQLLKEFFLQQEAGELELVNEVIKNLPPEGNLHLANSMSVRYANFIGLQVRHKGIKVFSNRGTSGIDGCTSTCIGHTLVSDIPNILITGDLAFFYDRNAFWHNYPLDNLRVVVLNNHGGIIFNMIDGPREAAESEEFFVTEQRLKAKNLCDEFGIEYLQANSKPTLKDVVDDFFHMDGKPKILELETEMKLNRTVFENLKQKIKERYEL